LADRFVFEVAHVDYGPVLLLIPFGFHLAVDTLSSPIFIGAGEALLPPLDMALSTREPEGLEPSRLVRCLAHTMCPADSHTGPILGYWFPKIVATSQLLWDASSCWVSQVPTASFRTRPPFPPRGALQVLLLVASLQVPGFTLFGRIATPIWCNEADPGSLALGLMRSQSGTVHPFASTVTVETSRQAHA